MNDAQEEPEAAGGTNLVEDLDRVSILRQRERVAADALKWSKVGKVLTSRYYLQRLRGGLGA